MVVGPSQRIKGRPDLMFTQLPAEQLLLDNLQASIVGRLINGIVHNMNGPMQILSMQLELFKREAERELALLEATLSNSLPDQVTDAPQSLPIQVRGRIDKLSQMEATLNHLEGTVNVIAKRCQGANRSMWEAVFLHQIIEEELAFWQGDLFFKHQVEKKIEMAPVPLIVKANEGAVRGVIDALFSASLERLKEAEQRQLVVKTAKEDSSAIMKISHTGANFVQNWGEIVSASLFPSSPSLSPIPCDASCLALYLAQAKAEQAGGSLEVGLQEATFYLAS